MTETVAPEQGCGCAEFQASRRRFLLGTSALAAGAALSGMTGVFGQVAFAAGGTPRNMLVVLSLRGGVDGLSLVVPHGDPAYYAARPTIAIPREQLICQGPKFGLHPALGPLEGMWKAGSFGAVHAVGLEAPNRSHFAAMEVMEDADLGSPQRRGWLNRMIGLDGTTNPLEAVHLGGPLVPTSLYGRTPVVAARGLHDLSLNSTQNREARVRRTRSLHRTWDRAHGSLGRAARSALSTANRLEHLATTPTRPANDARYPAGDLGAAMADTARLLRSGLGVETVTLDYGNWDMHVDLGKVDRGPMTTMATELAQALHAFFVDLGETLASQVTVVTISEFGRRVAENGGRGLDHGWGNVMLLLGAGVNGGQVHAGWWPGLGAGSLVDGDLRVERDYRSVLTEVLRSRFPGVDTGKVFPGFVAEPIGAMKPAG